jgi:multidrug efflux pump subunit AcrA (membrane-fusion protein)
MAVIESKEKLKRRTILSPIDGIVVKRHVSIGEYVGTDPVLELAALNPLNAEVIIEGGSYGKVEIGMQVTILASGQAVAGRVEIVDQVIDAASGTFGVRITVPNTGMVLPAGLACEVQFPVTSGKTL